MERTFEGKLPTELISKTLVGTTTEGREKHLIQIDQVERYNPTGSVSSFLRLILKNGIEDCSDSFYFSVDEAMERRHAFLQTTEANMKLLEWEMAIIQQQPCLNEFITTICREYFQELGYSNFRIV